MPTAASCERGGPLDGRLYSWRADGSACLLLASVALGLRLPYIESRSIWYDEASSWQTAMFPLSELPHRLSYSVHPPLYYLLLKPWLVVFGDAPVALRGLSVLFGVLTVVAVYFLAREVWRSLDAEESYGFLRVLAAFAALAVAVSPFQVQASIEARMYSLGTFLAVVSTLLLLRILRDPAGATGAWIAYVLTATAFLYTHHYSLFTVAGQAAAALVIALVQGGATTHSRWIKVKSVVVGYVLVGLLYLPMALLLRAQVGRVQQDYWIPALGIRRMLRTMCQLLLPAYRFHSQPLGIAVAVVLVATCIVLGTFAVRRRSRSAVVIWSLAFLPLVGSIVVSLHTPIWVTRYFRFTQSFLLLAVLYALFLLLHGRAERIIVGLLFLLNLAWANLDDWKLLDIPSRPGMRGAISYIVAEADQHDRIVVVDYRHYFPAKYYVSQDGDPLPVHLLRSDEPLFWGPHLISAEDLIGIDEAARTVEAGGCVWLIAMVRHRRDFFDRPGLQHKLERFAYPYPVHSPVVVDQLTLPSDSTADDRKL